MVHPGHIEYFIHAKKQGDILYVVLVGDKFVEKGPGRPLFPEKVRAAWVAALEPVDYVIIHQDIGPYKIIEQAQPQVLVKGASYQTKPTEGFKHDRALVESYGGRIEFAPEPMHSSEIIQKIYKTFE